MEGSADDQKPSTNENTPLISPVDVSREIGGGGVPNDPTKGFTVQRCMTLPMLACYFLAGVLYMYEVPQYTQSVMQELYNNDSIYNKSHNVYNACSSSINKTDPSYIAYTHVQQETAKWLIYFNVAAFLPAMFANLVWSSYSDILGRRFPLMLCFVGVTIRYVCLIVVIHFKLNLVYILIGNVLDGLTGAYTSVIAVLFAYVSDVTYPGKDRTIAIVMFELIIGLAITVSTLASGYFILLTSFFYTALCLPCISVVGLLIVIFLVPETMQNKETQRQSRNVLKNMSEAAKFYFCDGTRPKRLKYIFLMLGFLFLGMSTLSRGTLEVLYQLGLPFCWSPLKIGWFGSVRMGIGSVFGIAGAYVFKRFMADDSIVMLSLVATAVSFIVEGLAESDTAMYSGKCLLALSFIEI